jgi:predicted secreted protein
MRIFPTILVVAFLLSGPGLAHASSQQPTIKEMRAGETILLKLPGNPDAGYKWQLNGEESSGLDLVSVDQVGWIIAKKSGGSVFFSTPSVLNVAIRAKEAGVAKLRFDYVRNWGNRARVRTTQVEVIVKPQ